MGLEEQDKHWLTTLGMHRSKADNNCEMRTAHVHGVPWSATVLLSIAQGCDVDPGAVKARCFFNFFPILFFGFFIDVNERVLFILKRQRNGLP